MKKLILISLTTCLCLAPALMYGAADEQSGLPPSLVSFLRKDGASITSGEGMFLHTTVTRGVVDEDITARLQFAGETEKMAYIENVRRLYMLCKHPSADSTVVAIEKLAFDGNLVRSDVVEIHKNQVDEVRADCGDSAHYIFTTTAYDGHRSMQIRSTIDQIGREVFKVTYDNSAFQIPRFHMFGLNDRVLDEETLSKDASLSDTLVNIYASNETIRVTLDSVKTWPLLRTEVLIDATRFVFLSSKLMMGGNLLMEHQCSDYFLLPSGRWYPKTRARNKYAPLGGVDTLVHSDVFEVLCNKVQLNAKLEPDIFKPAVPQGAWIIDFTKKPPEEYQTFPLPHE